MLSKDSVINSNTGKQYVTTWHGNSVKRDWERGLHAVWWDEEDGEGFGRKKWWDDIWAEGEHFYVCWIKQSKLVIQIHTEKLERLQVFKQQWYSSYQLFCMGVKLGL
jgi:hypothetical protein